MGKAEGKRKAPTKDKSKDRAVGVREEAGVSKKAPKKAAIGPRTQYWAVQKGRVPGIYTNAEEAVRQTSAFSGAVMKKFFERETAMEFLAGEASAAAQRPAATDENAAQAPAPAPRAASNPTPAQAAAASSAAAGSGPTRTAAHTTQPSVIKYDRTALPRGFVLGCVRAGGKSVLDKAAEPVFGVSAEYQDTNMTLPQHRDLAAAAQAAQMEARASAVEQADDDDMDGEESEEQDEEEDSDEPGSGDRAIQTTEDSSLSGVLDDFMDIPNTTDAQEKAAEPAVDPNAGFATRKHWRDQEFPWHAANKRIRSQSLRLHNEIVELTRLLRPTQEEDEQRHDARQLLDELVQEMFPGSSLEVFGSFATGLHLPTSDVDCVILGAEVADRQVAMALRGLGKALQGKDWAHSIEVVSSAKVPIVKFIVMPYGLKFDVSIGKRNGVMAAGLIRQYLRDWPALRPIVTILKLFLLQRDMNEVFTGGLGSFALIISVVSFLELHQSRQRPLYTRGKRKVGRLESNLGILLIDYFRFYGRQLSYKEVGVSASEGGFCYNRARQFPRGREEQRGRGERYSIMDPLDPANDVSRGTFQALGIRSAFDHAYAMLTNPRPDRGASLLAGILRMDDVLAIRAPSQA